MLVRGRGEEHFMCKCITVQLPREGTRGKQYKYLPGVKFWLRLNNYNTGNPVLRRRTGPTRPVMVAH